MKSKKKILACAVILLCLSVMAQSTQAFYVRSETARNVITTSRIDIDLRETDAAGNPFVDQFHVLPGQQVEKEVTVRNAGPQDAYVRVRLEKVFQNVNGQPDASLVALDINSSDWTYRDGYYYYNEPLSRNGGQTPELLTGVTFSESMGNQYQGSQFKLIVTVQATQVANNGESVFEAKGWPM